jgi:hypothetical protein
MAIGCGDDDEAPVGGSGGNSGKGGTGGSSGKGGTGGSSGKGGTGGGASPAVCKVTTKAIFGMTPNPLPNECADCICDEGAAAITACNDIAKNCWGLLGCVAEKCAGKTDSDRSACAFANCSDFDLTGPTPGIATPAGAVIQGAKCSAKCTRPTPVDGADAGPDAGN